MPYLLGSAVAASLSLLRQMPHTLQMFTEHVCQPPHGVQTGMRIDGEMGEEGLSPPLAQG